MTEPKLIKIKLLKPHTHAGRSYSKGDEIELNADSAKWLISIKTAQEIK